MVMKRRKGLALSEALILIGAIWILAGKLAPESAKAREAQCLSNVKHITLAIRMYLADNNDTFPPSEHDPEALDYFASRPGGDSGPRCRSLEGDRGPQQFATRANPYLRWPVVLDHYLQNRALWQCPEAKLVSAAGFIVPGPDWLVHLRAHEGEWGDAVGMGPCLGGAFPSGWGGELTDSLAPGSPGGRRGRAPVLMRDIGEYQGFCQGIGTNEETLRDVKLVQLKHPAKAPIAGDTGPKPDFLSVGTLAYPDICCAECGGIVPYQWGWGGQAAGLNACPDGNSRPECCELHAPNAWWNSSGYDVAARAAATRHLGGSNVGFADGHASWIAAERLIAMSDEGELEGIGWLCWPYTSAEGYRENCGEPPAGMVFLYQRGGPCPSY